MYFTFARPPDLKESTFLLLTIIKVSPSSIRICSAQKYNAPLSQTVPVPFFYSGWFSSSLLFAQDTMANARNSIVTIYSSYSGFLTSPINKMALVSFSVMAKTNGRSTVKYVTLGASGPALVVSKTMAVTAAASVPVSFTSI